MRKGQSTLEYVYLIGIVAVAIIAVLVYVSRGFQGKLRLQANQTGEQYSPGNMDTNIVQNTTVRYTDRLEKDESWNDTSTVTTTIGSHETARDLRHETF